MNILTCNKEMAGGRSILKAIAKLKGNGFTCTSAHVAERKSQD